MDKNKILIPELNHHSLQDRRSRPLAQALPILNGRWYSSSQKHAFTIIEVVLVLAIAGLIFLMVFIALPALQRSQRDTQRKANLDRALAAFESYRANNRGRLPNFVHQDLNIDFIDNYLKVAGDDFRDPGGLPHRFYAHYHPVGDQITVDGAGLTVYPIHIQSGVKCSGDRFISDGRANGFAIAIVLEGGGVYCVNN